MAMGSASMITQPLALPASPVVSAQDDSPRLAVARHRPPLHVVHRSALLTGLAVTAILVTGASMRDQLPFTPKHGFGYGLGIAAGISTLLLLLYPVRKSASRLRQFGPLKYWFRGHMILGVAAPVLVLFHCGFRLGAPNSNVALFSMLLVAASGVVGRYIYTHISHGLYGARATLDELHQELDASAHDLAERLPASSRGAQRLARFVRRARQPRSSAIGRSFDLVALPLRAMWVHQLIHRDLHRELLASRDHLGRSGLRRQERATDRLVRLYIAALVREVQFRTYERLFSLWHAVHVPLFVMLLLTGILHVVAVHMY